jgi:MtaA/CmuA family methyltransferase
MNGRERFARALSLAELPDRVPVAPPFQGYWALDAFGVTVPESIAEPKKAIAAISKAQAACPFDAMEVVWDWFAFLDVLGCKSGIADAGSPIVLENPLTSIDQVADLQPVDTSGDERVKASIVAAEALLKEFKDEYFCYATIPLPFTLAGHMRDAAHLMSDIMKRADQAHQLLDYSTQVILEHLKLYAALGVDGFFICDPSASGNLLSPRHFEAFVAPYTRRVIEAVHELGLPTILHICGNTTKILPMVADLAPSALSFDHAVDPAAAKEAIGDSVCLLGNLDPADTLLADVDTVTEAALKCLDACMAGGGYVLGAGCDLSVETPIENIRTMIDVGHEATY